MIIDKRTVGIVVERQKVDNPWIDHRWRVVSVLVGAPDTPAWSELSRTPEATRYYAGAADLVIYSRETENLKHNLEAPAPSVYVVLRRKPESERGIELLLATVDPGEAHVHVDAGMEDIVEALPMPDPIRDWLAAFVAAHHVAREHFKRKRDKANPEALARGPRRHEGDDE